VQEEPIKLKHGMRLILGNKSEYEVSMSINSLIINGVSVQSLKLIKVSDTKVEHIIDLQSDLTPFTIGSARNSNLMIEDISENHAEIYFNFDLKRWMIKDHSIYGTFYRMKLASEINDTDGYPASEAVLLQEHSVFTVEGTTFIMLKP
jgi:hypothetical protein